VLSIADIEALFAKRGNEQYTGEPVTQLEHALQCAMLAEQHGADDALTTAALLHVEARNFIAQVGAADAVQVRIWDDLAKLPNLPTPSLSHFLERASRCVVLPVKR
jgi:predicted HD phosphohydrolase